MTSSEIRVHLQTAGRAIAAALKTSAESAPLETLLGEIGDWRIEP